MDLDHDVIKHILTLRKGDVRFKSVKWNNDERQGIYVFPGCEITVTYSNRGDNFDGDKLMFISKEEYERYLRDKKINHALSNNEINIILQSGTQSYES